MTATITQAITEPSLFLWEPGIQAFLNVSEEAFRGKEKFKLPSTKPTSYPNGSHVGCYYAQQGETELHWIGGTLGAVVMDSEMSNNAEGNLLVTFLEDGFTTWLPSDWCLHLDPKTVWEAGPFMYNMWLNSHLGDRPFSEFHLAFHSLNSEFPDSSPALFTYWQGWFPTKHDDTPLLGKDDSAYVEMESIALDPRLTMYMQQSYPSIPRYHALAREHTIPIDDKYLLFQLYQANEVAASVFPPTFGSIQEALKSSDDDNTLFYLKERGGSQGKGIRVLPRHDLVHEPDLASPPSIVIQRAIQDILTIDIPGPLQGRRFDIRYFFVVCRGKVYLHSNMYAMWAGTDKPFDPNDPSLENQVPKVVHYEPGKEIYMLRDFLFFPTQWYERREVPSSSSLDPISWRDEIAISLSKAKSVLQPLISATASDPYSYHMVGGDAIVEGSSGRAVLMEFNDWPDYSGFNLRRERCLKEQVCPRRVVIPKSDGSYVLTLPTAEHYTLYSGYTAQLLHDMVSLVMGLESPESLERFREIMDWTPGTEKCVECSA